MERLRNFLLKIFRPRYYKRKKAGEAFVKEWNRLGQGFEQLGQACADASESISMMGQALRLFKKPLQFVHSHIPRWARPIDITK